jgi:hypothetical protein
MYCIINYNNKDENNMKKIQYSEPFKTQGGAYSSWCFSPFEKNTDIYNVPVLIDTPEFIFSGIKTKECKHQRDKLYIEIEYTNKTKSFFDFIDRLRNYNIDYSYNNCKEWFSKQISKEEFEKLHYSFIEEKDNSIFIFIFIIILRIILLLIYKILKKIN